jgi:hypothetical protein
MKTGTKLAVGMLTLAFVVLAGTPTHAGAQVSIFRLRDRSLNAAFMTVDDCSVTTTFVRFSESVTQIGGPPIVAPPLTQVEVDYSNGCTGESLSLSGGTNLQQVHFAPDLSSASLSGAVVNVTDGTVSATVNLASVTWTANAPLQQSKDHFVTRDGYTLTFERYDFQVRSADVAGNMTAVLPLAAGPTSLLLSQYGQGGQLGKDVLGTRTVTFVRRR